MGKLNIDQILISGTPVQKMLLLSEDNARGKYRRDRLLTDSQVIKLTKIFKTKADIQVYNKFVKADQDIMTGLWNLREIYQILQVHYENMRGIILVWYCTEEAEILANSILLQVKDVEERKRIAQIADNKTYLLYSCTSIDEEGFIKFQVDYQAPEQEEDLGEDEVADTSLITRLSQSRDQANRAVITYMSYKKAILDYMSEGGYDIQTYYDQIKGLDSAIRELPVGWYKYIGKVEEGYQKNSRLERLIKKYDFSINLKGFSREEYNFYRREILKNEKI
jgi:hypothetical protein